MILYLLKYYAESKLFAVLSERHIRNIQIKRFRKVFEWARKHSEFYRMVYTEAGVMDLKIETEEDILKVPVVDKQMMRKSTLNARTTRIVDEKLVKSLTSGSNGIPLDIYATKHEYFTGYVRTFITLKGYNPFKPFVLIGTEELKEQAEKESFLVLVQRYFRLFRREIISVHNPPEIILERLRTRRIGVLSTTPSCLKILVQTAKRRNQKLNVERVVLSGEKIDETDRKNFQYYFQSKIINVYGCVEHPSLAWTKPNGRQFRYFANAVMFEHIDDEEKPHNQAKELVLTNFINKTMPFVRYKTGDRVKTQSGYKLLGDVEGRVDDVIDLGNGKKLFMYQMDAFTEIEDIFQFRIVQNKEKHLIFQVVGSDGCNKTILKENIQKCWNKYFPEYSIEIELMSELAINPTSGKFKRMEVQC